MKITVNPNKNNNSYLFDIFIRHPCDFFYTSQWFAWSFCRSLDAFAICTCRTATVPVDVLPRRLRAYLMNIWRPYITFWRASRISWSLLPIPSNHRGRRHSQNFLLNCQFHRESQRLCFSTERLSSMRYFKNCPWDYWWIVTPVPFRLQVLQNYRMFLEEFWLAPRFGSTIFNITNL